MSAISNSIAYKYTNHPSQPGRTLESDVIISMVATYISDAFTKENIPSRQFNLLSSNIVSIKSLPNDGYEIVLSIRTYSKSTYQPPYGHFNVTVIINGKSIKVTNISQVAPFYSY